MSDALDEFLRRRQAAQQTQAAVLAKAGADTSPDDAAKRIRIAREKGTTPAIAGQMPVEDHVSEATAAVARAPKVGEWVAGSGDRVALARGSLANMADIAQTTQPRQANKSSFLGTAAKIFNAAAPSGGPIAKVVAGGLGLADDIVQGWRDLTGANIARATGAGFVDLATGALGVAQAGLEGGLAKFIPGTAGDIAGAVAATGAGAGAAHLRQSWEKYADKIGPDTKTEGGTAVLSGVRSLPMSAASLAGGAVTKSATLAAALMGVTVGGQSYGRARDAGVSPNKALAYGGLDAVIEAGTEYLPFHKLMPGTGVGFMKRLGDVLLAEVPGEQLATLGQDFNQWAFIEQNQGKTFGDYLAERGPAAEQTLLATLVGAGAMSGTVRAAEFVAHKMGRDLTRAAPADDTARFLDALGSLAKANGVLQRDPASFEDFVASAAEGTDATHVYVEAGDLDTVLNQSDLTVDQVYAMTGHTPEELKLAADRGEDIAIPIEKYASQVAPSKIAEQLAPHLRLNPDDMSRAQAETFLQSAKDEFQASSEEALAGGLQSDERAASRARVEDRILGELNTTRRFTSDVNQVYASVVGAFFDTMGQRAGMTAEELADQYGLKVQSGEHAAPSYDQPPMLNIGLAIPEDAGGGQLSEAEVRKALKAAGVKVTGLATHTSDSEPTAVVQTDRPLTPEELDALSVALKQQAIPQFANGEGIMRGPMADAWGPFNSEFFLTPTGGRLSEVFNQTQQTETPEFKAWFGDSKVVDENGDPLVVYHGSRKQFDRFDRRLANVESDHGAGFYFTNDPNDLAANYAAGGGDLDIKVDELAARFERQGLEPAAAKEAALAELAEHGGASTPVYLSLQNPLVLSEEEEPFSKAQIKSIKKAVLSVAKHDDIFDVRGPTLNRAISEGMTPSDFYYMIREDGAAMFASGPMGQYMIGEFFRRVLSEAGFDGIIDKTVTEKFGEFGTPKGMSESTVHYVAFQPEQIKSINNRGTFNPNDPRLLFQSAAPLQTLPMQVRGSGPGGRVLNKDIGEALTLRHRAEHGRALDPSDPGDYAIALQSLLEDYADQQAQPNNGEAWYSDDIAEAVAITTRIMPELADPVRRDIFLTAVALLSPQQGPVDNWANALDAMTGYSIEGRFATRRANDLEFGVPAHRTGLLLFEHLINQYGEIGALVWLSDEHTGREMEELRRSSGLFKNKADKYLPKEMNFTEKKLGAYIFGPKVGDFMLNSTGLDQSAVTVDLWMARTYNRIIGRLMDVNEKQAAEGMLADAMRGKAERAIVKQLVRDAAQQAGIAPSAMQAALWYFEQRLYRNHGIRSESTSFSDAARRAAEIRGIPVDGVAAQGSAAGSDEAQGGDLEEGVRVYHQDAASDPLDAFKRQSFYPTRATRHADGTVYADIPDYYPERQAAIAEQLGASAVVAVARGDARLDSGVPLWFSEPPLNPDGTVTLHHWGPAGITETDPTRWGESGTLSAGERSAITSSLPRTFFGIASGQPGGYIVEFPGRTQYEARVPAEQLYDVAKDPDKLKPAASVPELERRIKAAGYIGYWTADPQLGLVATVFEPLKVQPARAQVLFQDAVFFSALERTIERTATQKASAQQWEATLRKTPGIKAEELEWTGLLDFLAMQEGPITRDQVLDVVRGAGIRVDEVVTGERRAYKDHFEAGWSIETARDDDGNQMGFFVINAAGSVIQQDNRNRLFNTLGEAHAFADEASPTQYAQPETQFSSWSSDPGNETYRELLITLPVGTGRNPNRAPSTHWDTNGVIAHARFMDKTDADGKRVLFIEEVQSDWHQKGRDQGYATPPDPEIMQRAATRYAETRARWEAALPPYIKAERELKAALLPLASRALKVNIESSAVGQSRSVQEGLRRQFRVEMLQDPSWNVQTSDYARIIEAVRGTSGAPNSGIDARAVAELNVLLEEMTETEKVYDALSNQVRLADAELQASRNSNGIPNAPFKTEWPALVMKRMIRWAAEHGYERIAWTTGEQQAERYNLSQAVGSLTLEGMHDSEGYRIRIGQSGAAETIASNGMGEIVERGYGTDTLRMTEGQMREAFGNDITARLLASDGETVGGEGLRVGGEGMKAFYDRNLVNITNKIVKKYGARVREVSIHADRGIFVHPTNPAFRSQPGFDITPELADAAMGGFPLFQRERGPRGQIALPTDVAQDPSVITLLRGADLSTFVHELGHFFFEVTNHMANQAGAPTDVVQMRDALLRSLGVESATEWANRTPAERRHGHEQIARSFEAFLFEGKAPSAELHGVFNRLRSWMLQVYRTITALKVDLTDEVRSAFSRMLASDEQIADVEADAHMAPLFKEQPEGMSDVDWEEYQRMNADATADAAVQLEARSLRDMRYAGKSVAREIRRLQRQVADQRAEMREEVEAELAQRPVYRATTFLRTGELDGQPYEGEHKLNTGLVREALGLGTDPLPDALRGMTVKDGLHPEQAAELLGFTSADHMLKDLLFASPFKDAVEAETDQRMRERYGEMNSPEDIEEAARAAVHNEVRGRFVATELAAIQKAPGKKRVLNEAARRIAEGTIARLRIRDIRPSQYEAAERRAAREAQQSGTQDIDALVRLKRNQLLQFHLAKAAHEAREETHKARDYLTKFNNKSTRANIDVDFLDQIDQLLERYELRQVSNTEADRRRSLNDWVEAMRAEGFEPALDPEMLADIGRKPWRELTVEEMRGLLDAVRNIEHLGRWTKKLLLAKDKADVAAAAEEMAQSVRDNAVRSIDEIVGSKTWWEKVKSGSADFFAMHRKIANMAYVFDGNRYGGAFWERFIRPMNDRGDWETSRLDTANKALADVFKLLGKENTTKREYIPQIERSLSLEDRLMVALNMGNAANLQRLMDGDRWTVEQVQAIIAPLQEHHWDFVEAMWREIDSYWPEIAEKERRVTGVVPEKVEPQPFQVQREDGSLRLIEGGYFPIKYDPDRSSKAAADDAAEVLKQMTRGLYTSAQTRRGHTKARVDEVKGRPLRKNFSVIFSHVNQVVHDLAWHEYLIDANRLLRSGAVDAAVREHYGPETLRWMRKALEDIAIGDLGAQNAFDAAVNHIRTGASIAAMGWNLWTTLQQPFGLTQSISRIGVKHVAKGIGGLLSNPAKMNEKVQWIYSVSPFMAKRGDTMQREINEIRNRIKAKSPVRRYFDKLVPPAVSGAVADSYFTLIAKGQLIADLPTWLGQYEKSLSEGTDVDKAVAIADQAVIDSQGSGHIKDLAGIQRGGPLMKLWTNFYSYFSATMNLLADRTTEFRRKGAKDAPYFAADVAMLTIVPASLMSLMYSVLRAGLQPGDDDDEILKALAADNASYLFGTMVGLREVAAAFSGYAGYQGPAGARAFADLAKLGKQVQQGEADEALARAANSTAGILLHYPATQVDRTARGVRAVANGDAGAQALLLGPPVGQ
jgi:hypothetical protein